MVVAFRWPPEALHLNRNSASNQIVCLFSRFVISRLAYETDQETDQVQARRVMRVTDNPGGGIYRLAVMNVASAQTQLRSSLISYSLIIPLSLPRS
jgi:hypothetical protein